MVNWGDYADAYKAIHDKIAEVLQKLDLPADPQTVAIISSVVLTVQATDLDIRDLTSSDIVTVVQAVAGNLKATVTQAEKDRTITSLPVRGTATRINKTANGIVVAAPSANYHLQLFGFVMSVDGDEICRLRWGGVSGDIIAMLPTKGVLAMNLINILERGDGGASPNNLYLEKTGSGNCQGTVWTETVAD